MRRSRLVMILLALVILAVAFLFLPGADDPAPPPPPDINLDVTTKAGINVLNNPSRSDYQGPRLASNVTLEHDAADGRPFIRVHSRPDPTLGWASGGFTIKNSSREYGTYSMLIRVSKSMGTRAVVPLWPSQQGVWPPEVDWVEWSAGIPNRNYMVGANHYRNAKGVHKKQLFKWTADCTVWHRYVMEWQENLLRISADGTVIYETTDPMLVPNIPMYLGFQTAKGLRYDPATATPGTFDIAELTITY